MNIPMTPEQLEAGPSRDILQTTENLSMCTPEGREKLRMRASKVLQRVDPSIRFRVSVVAMVMDMLDFDMEEALVVDHLRLVYVGGWKKCETRSPEVWRDRC